MKITGVHPVAALFPMMSDSELDDLAEDIKTNGQLHAIIVDNDGLLIDGRNRDKACQRAGVEPRIEILNGQDPVALIISANMARRQMTKGAIAMVAAMAFPEVDSGGRGKKSSVAERFPMVRAERLSVARTVLAYAPEHAEAVASGGMFLDAAYKVAQDRKSAASSQSYKMDELVKSAPDLADLVKEERMQLDEAVAAYREREQREKERRRLTTKVLAEIINNADYGAGTPENWAVRMADIDVEAWPAFANTKTFSIGLLRRAAQSLNCLAKLMEKNDGTEED